MAVTVSARTPLLGPPSAGMLPPRISQRLVASLAFILSTCVLGLVLQHTSITTILVPRVSSDFVQMLPNDMQKHIDVGADPCTDFYQFACGNYNPELPADSSSISLSWDTVDNYVVKEVHELLASHPKSFAGKFFHSCMDVAALNKRGVEPLREWFDFIDIEIDGTASGLARVLGRFHAAEIPAVFELTARADDMIVRNVLQIDKTGDVVMPSEEFYTEAEHKDERAGYIAVGAELLAAAGVLEPELSIQQAFNMEYRFVTFDNSLESNDVKSSKDAEDDSSSFSCSETHMQVSDLWKDVSSDLDWDAYFEMLSTSAGLSRYRFDYRNMTLLSYCPKYINHMLQRLLHNTSAARAYFKWHLVHDLAPALSIDVYNLIVKFDSVFNGVNVAPPRWKKCTRAVSYAVAMEVSRMFLAKKLSSASVKEAYLMVDRIRDSLASILSSVSWMEPQTRKAALKKIKAMSLEVALPSNHAQALEDYGFSPDADDYLWNALSASRSRTRAKLNMQHDRVRLWWTMSPITANAEYDPTVNALFIPAAILNAPFFDKSYAVARNFGAVGWIVGHEVSAASYFFCFLLFFFFFKILIHRCCFVSIFHRTPFAQAVHGFDNSGRLYDELGHNVQWWTPADESRFDQRAECIASFYSVRYRLLFAVGHLTCNDHLPQTFQIAGRHVRGNMTLGEDIADCGGLHSSYLAMNKYLADVEKRPASQFEKKLFFTSGAQNWCIKSQLKETILGVLTDEHAPAPVRVNAAFSQTPAFADVFQCKPGSKMNPVSKCDMW
jgi:predicted metalloendopeptidase